MKIALSNEQLAVAILANAAEAGAPGPIYRAPVPANEALEYARKKVALPMTLNSEQYRSLPSAIRKRAWFSSTVAKGGILDELGGTVQDLLHGKLDFATAHLTLQKTSEFLEQPLSSSRVDLMLRVNEGTAIGYAQKMRDNDPEVVMRLPCWQLERSRPSRVPRDWDERWTTSCEAAGDDRALACYQSNGIMAARKDSGVWEKLGDSTLWPDALDVDYPPFYFNSGMTGIVNLDDEESRQLGLLDEDEAGTPAEVPDLNEGVAIDYDTRLASVQEAVLEALGDMATFVDGVLSLV